ncbi:hypothetical protein AOLI_G00084050 [Acnodon oligacanthus]
MPGLVDWSMGIKTAAQLSHSSESWVCHSGRCCRPTECKTKQGCSETCSLPRGRTQISGGLTLCSPVWGISLPSFIDGYPYR